MSGECKIQHLLPGEVAWCGLQELIYDSEDGYALYLNGNGVAYREPVRRVELTGETVGFGQPGGLVTPLRILVRDNWRVVVDASMVDDFELRQELEDIGDSPVRRPDVLVRVHQLVGTGVEGDPIESEEDLPGIDFEEDMKSSEASASLPDHLHQRKLQYLLPGEVAWCIPWSMIYDPEDGNALYLDGDTVSYPEYPGGTPTLRVKREEDGRLVVDAKKVGDDELLDDVVEKRDMSAATLMRVDEIVGTSLRHHDGRYAPEKGGTVG